MESVTGNVLEEVREERQRQNKKFGLQNHNPNKWFVILCEELGEAAKECYEAGETEQPGELRNAFWRSCREELLQVAAVAVAMVESLDRNELKPVEDEGHAKMQTTKY